MKIDDHKLATHIGRQIRRFRERRELSQDGLAYRAGIDRSYVGRIERGQVSLTVEKLYEIALTLGTMPELFLPSQMDVMDRGDRHGD